MVFDQTVANVFQSTPPARGATPIKDLETMKTEISIHAPREGGDVNSLPFTTSF